MKILVTAGFAAILAAILFATNPTEADVGAQIEAQVLEQIDAANVDEIADPVESMLVATCKLGRRQCASLIRNLISVEYTDNVLFSQVSAQLGNGPATSCIGILTRLLCRDL
ncbi:hypothetical protein [Tateyamaria sp.]|uniref:hypothetical protein n=1 Tax=Tateyamaria sp. TaxID=1929288 RepID=UPI003B21FD5B